MWNKTSAITWRNAGKEKQKIKTYRNKPTKYKKGEGLGALFFLLPSMLGISVFFLIPFMDTLRRSFSDARGKEFAGLEQYQKVLGNDAFRLAAWNTARFIAVCIPLLLALSLVMALLVKSRGENGGVFKTSYLLPMAVPVASMVLLWQVLFHKNGLMNLLLEGFGRPKIDFMGSSAAFWVLVFTYLWKNSGYNMILWLAGLDGIPQSQYEAAWVDGATRWQCFWKITMPGLVPTLGLVTVLSLLNSFKVFREAFMVAGEYPHDSIYMLQHLFNNWFTNLDIGKLSAAAVLLCCALLGVILLMQRFLTQDS